LVAGEAARLQDLIRSALVDDPQAGELFECRCAGLSRLQAAEYMERSLAEVDVIQKRLRRKAEAAVEKFRRSVQ
jgi:hypothetical protein